MAKAKQYVIITDAKREIMWNSGSDLRPDIKIDKCDYRKGELGLIHPAITDFYSDLENNLKKADTEIFGCKITKKCPDFFNAFGDNYMHIGPYKQKKSDKIILLYDMHGLNNSGRYIIVPLKRGEYTTIDGTDKESIRKGLDALGKSMRIPLAIDELIDYSWRNLEAFDILMKDKIYNIPIEVSLRKIPKKMIEQREDFLRDLEDCETARARSRKKSQSKRYK